MPWESQSNGLPSILTRREKVLYIMAVDETGRILRRTYLSVSTDGAVLAAMGLINRADAAMAFLRQQEGVRAAYAG